MSQKHSILDELRQRRRELADSLPALRAKQDQAYLANSHALARDRAGVTHRSAAEAEQSGADEVTADQLTRDAESELRTIDAKISAEPRESIAGRIGRAFKR